MTDELAPFTRNLVLIGASAGGVQALTALFLRIPADTRATFLVVLHVPPYEPSALHVVLSRATRMRVVAAMDGVPLEAGTVYVASPDCHGVLVQIVEGSIVRFAAILAMRSR